MDNNLEQLQSLCGRLNVPVPPPPPPPPPEPVATPTPEPVLYRPTPEIACWHCDFRQLPLEDGTADYICTDIPGEPAGCGTSRTSPSGVPRN